MSAEHLLSWWRMLLLLAAAALLPSGCSDSRGDPTVYRKHCTSCHGSQGQGLRALYPPLQGSAYLGERLAELPCLVSTGVRGTIVTGKKTKNIRMPALSQLSLEEMSSLVNYLQLNWGTGGETVAERTVAQWLRSCP